MMYSFLPRKILSRMFAGEREDISKNTIAKKYEECFLVRDATSRAAKRKKSKMVDGGAGKRSARLKCVWRNYTSFAARNFYFRSSLTLAARSFIN